MSTPVWDRAVEAATKARFEDTFSDPDDPKWDEIDAAERQEWLDVMRVALAAGLPLLLDDLAEKLDARAAFWGQPGALALSDGAAIVRGFAGEVRGE